MPKHKFTSEGIQKWREEDVSRDWFSDAEAAEMMSEQKELAIWREQKILAQAQAEVESIGELPGNLNPENIELSFESAEVFLASKGLRLDMFELVPICFRSFTKLLVKKDGYASLEDEYEHFYVKGDVYMYICEDQKMFFLLSLN